MSNPMSDFLSAHPEVSSLGFEDKYETPARINFVNGTSEETKELIRKAAEDFNWIPKPPPSPLGFQSSIMDKIGSGDLSSEWITYLSIVFSSYTQDAAKAKAYFTKITGDSRPDWMTQTEIDLVANQASQAFMPLQ